MDLVGNVPQAPFPFTLPHFIFSDSDGIFKIFIFQHTTLSGKEILSKTDIIAFTIMVDKHK